MLGYYRALLRPAFKAAFSTWRSGGALAVFVVSGAAFLQGVANVPIPWPWLAAALLALVAYELLRENYKEVMKGRAATAALERGDRPCLEIVYEPVSPFVQVDIFPDAPPFRHVRVGVRNLSGKRIDHAVLKLQESDPYNAFTPIELSERHDMGAGGIGTHQAFAINADDTAYVDVAMKKDGAGQEIVLRYARWHPNQLKPDRYVLTLRATAPEGEGTSRRFVLSVNEDHQLTLEPMT